MRLFLSFTISIFMCSVCAFEARGFDIYPEYQGINEQELLNLGTPTAIDSEYQTDLNAYWLPFAWELKWYEHTRSFDLTAGSLTNQHFLLYSRAKIQTDLDESLRFHFTYFQQRDREIDQTRHIVELSYEIAPWLRFNAYGEPSLYKRENDFGLALLLSPSERLESRLFVARHDFTRSQHNDLADRYEGDEPLSMGWTGRWSDETTSIRAGVRYDRPVEWIRPQEGRSFHYDKRLAFADAVWRKSASAFFGLRAQWNATHKSQHPLASSTTPAATWLAERFVARLSYQYGSPGALLGYEGLLTYASRNWRYDADGAPFAVAHANYLPGVNVRIRGPRRRGESGQFDHFLVGYEMTVFRSFGDRALLPPDQKHDALEGRMQAAYELGLNGDSRLVVAFNFDMDEWTGVPTFEGGNAQFRADF